MKRFIVASLAVLTLGLSIAEQADACHRRCGRRRCGGGCYQTCDQGCGGYSGGCTTYMGGPDYNSAPAAPQAPQAPPAPQG